jgi:excisionase family DNA binding protein
MPDEPDKTSGEEAARKLISLTEAAKISGLSSGHLRLLVSRGMIWGAKIGRNWVTTEAAVQEYLAQDRRPGPKSTN